jgi:hypothetical protein
MNSTFEQPAGRDLAITDLRALRAVVAASPILAPRARTSEDFFPDWQMARKSANVDALVLGWIASHVTAGAPHRGPRH